MNQRGIVNLEILLIIITLLIITLFIINLAITEFSNQKDTQIRMEARQIITELTQVINTVYINGDGYSQEYTTPRNICTQSYIIEINNNGIYLNSHNQIVFHQIIPTKLSHFNNNSEIIILSPGTTYQFINNNQTIEIQA